MATEYGTVNVAMESTKLSRLEGRTWRFHCGLVLHGVVLVVLLLVLVSVHWVSGVVLGQPFSVGLWRACLQDQCVSLLDSDSRLAGILGGMLPVQTLAILAAIIYVLSFFYAIVLLFPLRIPPRNLEGLAVLLFVGGIIVSMTTAVYYLHVYRRLTAHDAGKLHVPFLGYMMTSSLGGVTASLLYAHEYRAKTVHVVAEYIALK